MEVGLVSWRSLWGPPYRTLSYELQSDSKRRWRLSVCLSFCQSVCLSIRMCASSPPLCFQLCRVREYCGLMEELPRKTLECDSKAVASIKKSIAIDCIDSLQEWTGVFLGNALSKVPLFDFLGGDYMHGSGAQVRHGSSMSVRLFKINLTFLLPN